MGDPSESKKPKMSELEQFDAIFPELVNDVLNCPAIKGSNTQAAVKWFREVPTICNNLRIEEIYSEFLYSAIYAQAFSN
jgi:hypothetical protein